MSRVLITGARGFIGRHCLPPLVEAGLEPHGVTTSPAPPPLPGVTWHRADLLDAAAVDALLRAIRPTHLLHLAWVTTPGHYWTAPENDAWAVATGRLAEGFGRGGGIRAVMAGTCAEYDWSAGRCREGETPLRPSSRYGRSKDRARVVLEAQPYATAWARLFWLYGPHEHPARLVPSIVRPLLRGEPAACSRGTQRRDFLHVADAARALVALLVSDVTGAVNVASGEAPSVAEVAMAIGRQLEATELIRLGERPTPPDEAPLVVADVARLREEVGSAPRFDLALGLADTIAFWRKAEAIRDENG